MRRSYSERLCLSGLRKINAAINAALREPALLKQLDTEGLMPLPGTPDEYAQLVRSDTERWGQLVRSMNLKAN